MTELQFAEEVLDQLQEKHPRFHGKAYLFLLSALQEVMQGLEEPRHITGPELADGVRRLALGRFGPLSRTVLQHWGIHSTEDLGDIVFALVECGVLIRQEGIPEKTFGTSSISKRRSSKIIHGAQGSDVSGIGKLSRRGEGLRHGRIWISPLSKVRCGDPAPSF